MQAYEMKNKAKEGLGKKLAIYREAHPIQDPPVTEAHNYDTYESAKEAKDVQGMLTHKLNKYYNDYNGVVALSNKVYADLPIKEILKGVNELKASVQEKVNDVDTLREAQKRKIEREYKRIGGLTGIRFITAVEDALSEYENTDKTFLQAVADAQEEKKKYTAYCNARDMYIEENKDLIEEERQRARERTVKEEIRESGLLEALGITPEEE